MMLLKYKVQRDYQKNIIDPELLKRQEELEKKELYLKKLEQEVLGGDNHQKYFTCPSRMKLKEKLKQTSHIT